jgi:hypothetical protein
MNAVHAAVRASIPEHGRWRGHFTITKYRSEAHYARRRHYAITRTPENLLLNAGIQNMLDLLCATASPTTFSNANAFLGVGDSATAAVATQTQLQAVSNLAFVGMVATYPSRAAQTMTWQASFGSSTGNFAWNEFCISSGSTNSTGVKLNRLVRAQGTKTSGQVWVLTLTVTIS